MMEFALIVLYFTASLHITPIVRAEGGWNYEETDPSGPDHWHEIYEQCGGSRQSPINIITENSRSASQYSPIQYVGYDSKASNSFTLTNNGHTVQVATNNDKNRVNGGGLPGVYVLVQLHFHWGEDDTHGSEHLLDGRAFPLEIHFVHRNQKYNDVGQALPDGEGLAVLGVFAELTTNTDKVSTELKQLLDQLESVKYKGSTSIPSFKLGNLLPKSQEYYRYSGSLTTPGCNECVVWTVFEKPIKITSEMLKKIRDMHESLDEPIHHNYRPVQPLNDRLIYKGAA